MRIYCHDLVVKAHSINVLLLHKAFTLMIRILCTDIINAWFETVEVKPPSSYIVVIATI